MIVEEILSASLPGSNEPLRICEALCANFVLPICDMCGIGGMSGILGPLESVSY